MTKIDEKINSIIRQLHNIFHNAIGPRNRREYMHENNICGGIDWHFSLSADDIIKNKIPAAVVGCTGIAKVFCKFASEMGLDCVVIATARISDMDAAEKDRKMGRRERTISGHQIIAVRDKNGTLRAFDPGRKCLKYIDTPVQIGGIIPFIFGGQEMPHRITAILSPAEFANINTYKKLRDLYVKSNNKSTSFKRGKQKLNFWSYIKILL